MNRISRIAIYLTLLATPDSILAQIPALENLEPSENSISLGYNTFGEFYIGGAFPRRSNKKLSVQAGYQFALTSEMSYTWGPFDAMTPWLTNNCKGIRIRAGYQFADRREKNHATIFLETHQLESNPFINQDFSGSNQVPVIYFTETYQKYGVRFMNAIPLDQHQSIFLTFSVGIFYSIAHRTYQSISGGLPLPPDSDSTFTTPQLTIGLQFLLF
jgi:hypothetical protein